MPDLRPVHAIRAADAHRVRLLIIVACAALALFGVVTVLVTTKHIHGFDARAFRIANDLRAPWLDTVARVVTTLGLIAVVGPAVVLAGAWLFARRRVARAAALVAGAGLAWLSVWIIKSIVDRARPPAPLVHTAGQSYPSAHAANSVGWFALALALAVLIPARGFRVAAITAGAALAALVGLSRIYLRAHYASDVIGGESLGTAMYALAALGALAWRSDLGPIARRHQSRLDAG